MALEVGLGLVEGGELVGGVVQGGRLAVGRQVLQVSVEVCLRMNNYDQQLTEAGYY